MLDTISQRSISSAHALRLVSLAVEVATAQGIAIAAVVVDAHGRIKAQVVMDNAALIADALVVKKARTALLGLSSADFAAALEASPAMAQSFLQLPDICLLGGGYPLVDAGVVVGAFAVGGATVAQDMACAEVVLAGLG